MKEIITYLFALVSIEFFLATKAMSNSPQQWVPVYQRKSLNIPAKEKDIPLEDKTKKTSQTPIIEEAGVKALRLAYKSENKDKKDLLALKQNTLKLAGKAVPVLIDVMKDESYPEKNRWVATFLLGRIMGTKASPFISKFLSHPNWIMRVASLKTLLSLSEKQYGSLYAEKLKDASYIVRVQALENIRQLKLSEFAPDIWAMLFDESNYTGNKGKFKRTDLIKNCIRTVGDLKYEKVKSPIMGMIQKRKYDDIFDDLDYTLGQITGKPSPNGDKNVKKIFWSRLSLTDKQF